MSEPRVVRTKSIADIRAQANRIQQEIINRIGTPLADARMGRYRRTEEIAQRYMENIRNSRAFSGERDIQVSRSQYMGRRNNRT